MGTPHTSLLTPRLDLVSIPSLANQVYVHTILDKHQRRPHTSIPFIYCVNSANEVVEASSGTVLIEGSVDGGKSWTRLQNGKITGVNLLSTIRNPPSIYTPLTELRFEFIDLIADGAVGVVIGIVQETGASNPMDAFPDGVFTGERAVTIQGYTEANTKRGSQFTLSTFIPALAGGATADTIITTGDKPIVIKGRVFQYDGEGVEVTVHKNPTYTGGAQLEYSGLNDIYQDAKQVTVLGGVAVQDPGEVFIHPRVYLGSSQTGVKVVSTIPPDVFGLETIFAPNTSYLIRTRSIDPADTQRVALFTTWYQGFLDLVPPL